MKSLLYSLLNILTFFRGIRIKISGFGIRIPVRYFRYFEENYELNNISFINNYLKEGMNAVDIGAHIGLMSVIISKKTGPTGKVYAFEPTPSTFSILQKTIAINQCIGKIIPLQMAVSDRSGSTTFFVTDIAAHNSNSLSNNKRDYGNEHGIEVALTSLDDFKKNKQISRIDFIKIDAEGAELSVLKGAKETLLVDKPLIILALHPSSITNFGDDLPSIWDFIAELGYNVVFKNHEMNRESFIEEKDLFDVFLFPKVF